MDVCLKRMGVMDVCNGCVFEKDGCNGCVQWICVRKGCVCE